MSDEAFVKRNFKKNRTSNEKSRSFRSLFVRVSVCVCVFMCMCVSKVTLLLDY
jgi:hypothetical protein